MSIRVNNRMRNLFFIAALIAVFAPSVAHAERPYVAIEQRLSAEQMRATGLDQLSAEQLTLLNRLLRDEQTVVVAESKRDVQKQAEEPVSSTIRGEVRGWEKGTVFELENGQRWQVVDGEYYSTSRLTNPKATVRPGLLSSWYLRIEGISVGAKVKRIAP